MIGHGNNCGLYLNLKSAHFTGKSLLTNIFFDNHKQVAIKD